MAIQEVNTKFPNSKVTLYTGNCNSKYNFIFSFFYNYFFKVFRRRVINSKAIISIGGIGTGFKGLNTFWSMGFTNINWYVPMLFPPKPWHKLIYYRSCLKFISRIITITEKQLAIFEKYGNADADKFILKNFTNFELMNKQNSNNGFRGFSEQIRKNYEFLLVGRCHLQKGLDNLAQAINTFYQKQTSKNIPNIHVKVIGCKGDESYYKNIKSYDEKFTITPVPWTYYPFKETFDAVLMPSRYEGDPLLLHECRLLKVPVLVNSLDCLEEILLSHEKIDFDDHEHCIEEIISKLCIINQKIMDSTFDFEYQSNIKNMHRSYSFFSGYF